MLTKYQKFYVLFKTVSCKTVDDIIFGATQDRLCEEFVAAMKGEFEMSMMGELSFFLGLQVKKTKDGIFLSQSKYCKEILKKFEMESCKEASTPMPSSCYMDADAAGKCVDQTKYRGLIGSFLYLTASRSDIMFAVCLCARYQANPKESHFKVVVPIKSLGVMTWTVSDYVGRA